MGLNLASLLTESASRTPALPAIRLGDVELSYGELDERSARLATLLGDKGVGPGDRVGVMLPNVPEFPVAYYGVLRAGAVVVPMNVLLKRREIAFYLEDSGSKLLLAWHGFCAEAREGAADAGAELIEVEPASFAELLAEHEPTPGLHETDEEDTAVILYTSGTTGKPKGAELTHVNLFRNADVSSRTTCEIAGGDVVLGALPLFHSFGQTVGMNSSLKVGACLTLVPRFDPGEALATMQRDKVTHFYGVPTMFGALLHHPERESYRHLLAAHLHHWRRLDAGRGPARLRRGLRRGRARGLRPLGDLAGRLLQPPRQRAQGRARSAPRSKGSRCRSSTRTTSRSPRARSARS